MEPLVMGGHRVDASDGRGFPLTNPATGELITRVAFAGEEDVARAVAAAARAQPAWEQAGPARRAGVLSALADLIDAHAERLARMEATDNGLPISETRGMVARAHLGRALRVSRQVRSGVLAVNANTSVYPQAPFGGVKRSGIGREYGMEALEGNTELKTLFLDASVAPAAERRSAGVG